MQILYAIFGTVASVLAVFARVFFYHAGKTSEQLKSEQRDNDALREEIDRLNAKPATHSDRMRLFERAKVKARDREKTKL